jgi:hypothetical protein
MKIAAWTLDEALDFVRAHQPTFWALNYHVALGGGVLNNGRSYKDLDLIVMAMCNSKPNNYAGLVELLAQFGAEQQEGDPEYEQMEIRQLFKGTVDGKPIDWFVYKDN